MGNETAQHGESREAVTAAKGAARARNSGLGSRLIPEYRLIKLVMTLAGSGAHITPVLAKPSKAGTYSALSPGL